MENKFTRCEKDDPNRCVHVHPTFGQCPYKSVQNTKYCPRHSGSITKIREQKQVNLYRAALYSERIKEQANNPSIKSLRDEIGILRIIIDTRLSKCNDDQDLLLQSSALGELLTKVQVLVQSCHKIEKDLGTMLDKVQAQEFAKSIIDILTKYVDNPEILEMISEDMLESLEAIINAPKI